MKNNEVLKALLKYKDYRIITITDILTGITSWAAFIAMLFLVADFSDSALQIGIFWSISGLLPILFSFITGVYVDRLNLKKILIIPEFLKGILYIGFLFLPLFEPLVAGALFIILRFFISLLSSVTNIARQTILPEIVDEKDLVVVNSFKFTITSFLRLIGGASGGVIMVMYGANFIWVITLISFIVSGFMLLNLNYKGKKEIKSKKKVISDLVEGFKIVRAEPLVIMVLISGFCGGLVMGSYNILLEQMTSNVYDVPEYGVSLLYLSEGLVAIILGYWIASKKLIFNNTQIYGYIYILTGLSWAIFGFTINLISGMLILMVYAITNAFKGPFETQIMQTHVENRYRGRVFGLWNISGAIPMQIGVLSAGIIIEYLGIYYVAFIICLPRIIMGVVYLFKLKEAKYVPNFIVQENKY